VSKTPIKLQYINVVYKTQRFIPNIINWVKHIMVEQINKKQFGIYIISNCGNFS